MNEQQIKQAAKQLFKDIKALQERADKLQKAADDLGCEYADKAENSENQDVHDTANRLLYIAQQLNNSSNALDKAANFADIKKP